MKTIFHNQHKIEVGGVWKEKVFYDGRLMSSKLSVFGSTHIFRVTEENIEVQYEVSFHARWHGLSYWAEIRRAGEIIYTDR